MAVRETAVHLLFFAALFQLSDAIQVNCYGALRGCRDTKIPMLLMIFAYWGIGLPVGYGIGIIGFGPIEFGWHVQIHLEGDQTVKYEALLMRIVSPIVFDHMARLPQPQGLNHPAFEIVRRLIDKGKTWVKLSSIYQDTKVGPPTYADQTEIARAYLKEAPERMIWGSDWPHPTERDQKPNDAVIFDLIAEWSPDETLRERLLVDNPSILYDFPRQVAP